MNSETSRILAGYLRSTYPGHLSPDRAGLARWRKAAKALVGYSSSDRPVDGLVLFVLKRIETGASDDVRSAASEAGLCI